MKIETLKNLIRALVLSLIVVVAVIAAIKVETIQPGMYSLFVMLVFVMIATIVDFLLKEYLIEKIILQLIKANEARIVQKGWGNLICQHKLSDSSEELLVTLAKTSEKHRKILLNYGEILCLPAAERFVKELFDYLEEFLLSNRYQPNILSILVNNYKTKKKYRDFLKTYVKKDRWGYAYLSNFVKELIENKQIELLVGYCLEEKCMYPADEVTLAKEASKDPSFKHVLKQYLKAIKSVDYRRWRTEDSVGFSVKCGLWQNNVREEAENELILNGSYEIIKLYCEYVENLYISSQHLLARRYQENEDEEIKNILLRQELIVNEVLTITGLVSN